MLYFLLTIFFLLFPAFILFLEGKYSAIKKIGAAVICYGAGLIIGNSGLLPYDTIEYQEQLSGYVIVLAIPLVLFSLDIKKWITMAGETFLSLALGLVSVVLLTLAGYFLFREEIPQVWKVSGVLTGFYSGGAPNAAAISYALDMKPEVFIQTQTYDLLVGAVLLLFIMTIAQRFFLLFMRPYKQSEEVSISNFEQVNQEGDFKGLYKLKNVGQLALAFLLSLIILGLTAGISLLLFEKLEDTVIILGITSLAILASFIPKIRRIRYSFAGGMYLILVFCLVFASMADISQFSTDSLPILYYIILVVPGALLLHGFLSWLFKIDVDNFLIVSIALSMSPPFVPVVASSLKNKEIILPGMIVGMLGYATGNFLGILLANFLDTIS
jgi:uncharacterized membrane protein